MWTLDTDSDLPLWRPGLPVRGVTAAFTTRIGGVSAPPFASLNLGRSTPDQPGAIAENRRRVLAALGLAPHRLATAGQVHGARVAEARDAGHTPECDALLTRTAGLALAVTVADCLPIVLIAPGVVAAVHAGWRGAALGIVRSTVTALVALGAPADRIAAHIGPAIRACCYEVGADVRARFPDHCFAPSGDRWKLDLARAARDQLLESGLAAGAIHDLGVCTACDPARYFSHRRDGSPSGRMWAVIALDA